MLSQETIVKIADLRTKARSGTMTPEEVREAIVLLRGDRLSAASAATRSKSGGKSKTPVNSDALLAELE